MIDEHLELNDMVQEKAMAGKKALGAWFSRCRVEVGDIGVGTFRKLMSSLVECTMLYGAEIWGCNRNLEGVEQTQLRALRMFFGVGTLHPKVSLLAEMGDLPIRWRAKLQCVLFWVRVLSSRVYDGWLIRQVATEAVKFGRGSWLRKMSMCCKEFGWKDASMEGVRPGFVKCRGEGDVGVYCLEEDPGGMGLGDEGEAKADYVKEDHRSGVRGRLCGA